MAWVHEQGHMTTAGTEAQGTPSGGANNSMPYRKVKINKITTLGAATVQAEGVTVHVATGASEKTFPKGQWFTDVTVSANAGGGVTLFIA